ncbi:hypothetical protein HMPREF1022_01044 [Desulfovibrio sp. 6_1_46AFAA]|uniref:glycosyltransferase family 2 protein n=1 Tax=Desulfovibrio sp. 6_1_46AFAA TaxID=665942 RepID=UPI0002236AE2|nr:glycosyltransferase family 2 protein [Desulfovibrio sp. 6_1_46AFAA]EGW51926.1 hypothetical protein HMPREF1022_01044 [Desulfovibrio sp. 6_1_46AFAA]
MIDSCIKRPTLSIITVCLNEPLLQRTCESIVNQTFQDFEWIVIDGGSTDETLEIFKRYKSRMDYFVSEPDGGIYFGMNKGIQQAHGTWLNFMNAGDMFVEKETLQKIFGCDDNYKNTDVLYGLSLWGKKMYTPPSKIDKIYLYRQSLPHQASFFRRNKCDMYDTTYRVAADWRFFISMYDSGCIFKNLNLVVAVQDNNGISRENTQQHINERKRIKYECFNIEEQRQGDSRNIEMYKDVIHKKRIELRRLNNYEIS